MSENSQYISDIGIRYGTSGNFESSITLTEQQASDLTPLQLQLTTADVDADQIFDINIETVDP